MVLFRSLTDRKSRRGAIAVWVAVCLVLLLGVAAVSLDGGVLWTERRHAQSVADAAAMAAASDLYDNYWANNGLDPKGSAQTSALTTAAANGYANDGTTSLIMPPTLDANGAPQHGIWIPPLSGDYKNKSGYVEVVVEYRQKRAFSRIFGTGDLPVRARAVALGAPIAANVGILVLDPDDKGALNAQGGGITVVKETPIIVNSNHPEAAIGGGGGYLEAPDFYITGGYTTVGTGAQFVGEMHTGVRPTPDPFADLPVPDVSTMTVQSNRKIQYTSGSMTLSPGVYKKGITVSGTGSLTLQPGIYYMDGGGFSFTGQGSLTGQGVMIYNAPGNGNADGINISGQGSINISGPTSGPYAGITFFQDRTSNVTGTVAGEGQNTNITGTFYFAGALLKVTGNGPVANLGSQYISRLLDLGGNGTIKIQWNPFTVGRKRSIHLVE